MVFRPGGDIGFGRLATPAKWISRYCLSSYGGGALLKVGVRPAPDSCSGNGLVLGCAVASACLFQVPVCAGLCPRCYPTFCGWPHPPSRRIVGGGCAS